ncbi:putative disease resistance protein At1g58400 [Telopea speciosissima]|uniref:putative disease resistance protein At1g58400 n=1 Tax=Telopea speciosissima TaxID=54955 RepID=UPI001CC460B8|nr:putative disease resistance protein At1g58400 [Telopea speciosissima]
MAEAAVKSFLQRLSSLILQENEASPTALQDQIKKLQNRLEEIGSFPREVDKSKQEDGLVCNWESDLMETLHDANNCIDQYVTETRSQDESNQALSIVQFCSELEKIDASLAGISRRRSQLNMPPTLEAKEEIEQSSSTDGVDEEGEESLAPFALKYSNLPFYLRSCLLYCSLFPEKISRGRLVRLLVAEGILQEKPGEVMEDIAEENINELVRQGMLGFEFDFKNKNELKVEDPYHIICQIKLQEGEGITPDLVSDSNFPQSSRIVFIHYRGEIITTSLNDHSIRSLHVFSDYSEGLIPDEYRYEGIPDDHWACVRNAFFHNFNFLRVLDLENLKIKSLPEEIGDLIQLRYLGLKHSALNEIPESIGNLQNLQTLDIRWPRNRRLVLPIGVLNLLQLRHLKLPMNQTEVPSGIGILTNLLSLTGLFARPGIIEELRSLIQLRKLELMDVSEEHASELSASIMKMRGLVSLSLVTSGHKDELLPTWEPFSPPPCFKKLRLDGRLMDLPHWVISMENLTKLRLGYSFLPKEAVSVLKELNKEFCRVGGFPKLEELTIASMNLVEWTEIEEGAFPSLEILWFHNCPQLMNLPEGLQNVTTLKVLKMIPLHPDHELRLKPDGGEENYKIKHIPLVQLFRMPTVFDF